jgi:TPR repeat protein
MRKNIIHLLAVISALILASCRTGHGSDGAGTSKTAFRLGWIERGRLEKRALHGDGEAARLVAYHYLYAGDHTEECVPWFEIAARDGDSASKYHLVYQRIHNDKAQDLAKAEKLLAELEKADTDPGHVKQQEGLRFDLQKAKEAKHSKPGVGPDGGADESS